MSEFPVLDLTGADTSDGFAPIPAGTYPMTIFEVKWDKTKGEGVLPVCPMLKVQLRIEDDATDPDGNEVPTNRRFFTQFVIPPKEVDGKPYENHDKMNGIFARFLESAGQDLEEVTSPGYELDLSELKGQPVRATLGVQLKYGEDPEDPNATYENVVKSIKPPLQNEGGLV